MGRPACGGPPLYLGQGGVSRPRGRAGEGVEEGSDVISIIDPRGQCRVPSQGGLRRPQALPGVYPGLGAKMSSAQASVGC